jgi:hypothetical protein
VAYWAFEVRGFTKEISTLALAKAMLIVGIDNIGSSGVHDVNAIVICVFNIMHQLGELFS